MLRASSIFAASAFAAALGASGAARADGMDGSLKDAPAIAESYAWDGLYVGFGGGVGSFDHNGTINTSKLKKTSVKESHKVCEAWDSKKVRVGYSWWPVIYCKKWGWKTTETSWSGDPDTKSGTFGDDDWNLFGTVQIGYDRLFHKHLLIGAFADVDIYRDADSSISGKLGRSVALDGSLDLERVWSVGGRLGFLVTPRILLYGVGGYTEAKLNGALDVSFNKTPVSLALSDDLKGYFIGGGGEIKLHRNISFKLEYRYADYDGVSFSASGQDTFGPYACGYNKKCKITKEYGVDGDLDAEIHSVRAALVVKFGDHEPAPAPLK